MKYNHLLILLLALAFPNCTGENGNDKQTEQTLETVLPEVINEVAIIKLKSSDFNHELISNGRLSARKFVDLRFESPEIIADIYVKNGDRVIKGQQLAELTTFRLKNKVAQEKVALEKAKLELQDVLIGQGYTLEDSAKVPAATMLLVRTRSGYDQAVAQYELAVYDEQHAVLTAPFDGVVANLFTKQYNKASTTDIFCTIIDPQSLEASFTVLESELSLIKTGDKVEVSPFAIPGEKTVGNICEINPLVDANGMVQVKASVKNSGKLYEGMNVRVSIQRPLANQLVVPKEAVVLRSGKEVVFTHVDGKAHWNYVQTGLENAGYYTILEGLKENDEVIRSGNINLAHDAPVKIIKE